MVFELLLILKYAILKLIVIALRTELSIRKTCLCNRKKKPNFVFLRTRNSLLPFQLYDMSTSNSLFPIAPLLRSHTSASIFLLYKFYISRGNIPSKHVPISPRRRHRRCSNTGGARPYPAIIIDDYGFFLFLSSLWMHVTRLFSRQVC